MQRQSQGKTGATTIAKGCYAVVGVRSGGGVEIGQIVPFKGSEAHAGVYAFALLNGTHAGPSTCVAHTHILTQSWQHLS